MKQDYEKQKAELIRIMDVEEAEKHTKEMRESRNAAIETDVQLRRTRAERDKVTAAIQQDEREY